jgi:uncharacterized membrane protein YccC
MTTMEIRDWVQERAAESRDRAYASEKKAERLEKRRQRFAEIERLILERNNIEGGLQLLIEVWNQRLKGLSPDSGEAAALRIIINELHETCDVSGIG